MKQTNSHPVFTRDERIRATRDLLLKGYSRKAVACELDVTYHHVSTLIPYTGLALIYVTEDERKLLTQQRKLRAQPDLAMSAA